MTEAESRPRGLLPPIQALDRWWVAGCSILLIIASDYPWRVRDVGETLGGRPDLAVFLELAAYGVVAGYLLIEVLDKPSRRPVPLLAMVWGFGITLAVSALYSPAPMLAFARGVQLIIACLLCQAVALHATPRHMHRLLHAYILLCGGSVLFGFAVPFPRIAIEANRFTFLYVHPVSAGTILGLGLVCALGCWIAARRREPLALWPAWAYGGLFVLISLGLVLTITRGAIAGALLGCGVAALVASARKQKADLAVFGLAAVTLIGMLAGGRVIDYLERGHSWERLRALNARTTLWDAALARFSERPLHGHGVTAARSLFLEDIGLGGAHNAFVEVAVSNGIIGLIWWIGMLGLIIAGLVRLRPRYGGPAPVDLALLSGLMTFLIVNGLTTEGSGTPANVQSLWLLLIAGWLVLLHREHAWAQHPEEGGQPYWTGYGTASRPVSGG